MQLDFKMADTAQQYDPIFETYFMEGLFTIEPYVKSRRTLGQKPDLTWWSMQFHVRFYLKFSRLRVQAYFWMTQT